MVNSRTLSDDELHKELVKIGITTPVTASTRSLLIKKLQQNRVSKLKSRKQHVDTGLQVSATDLDNEVESQSDSSYNESISYGDSEDDKETSYSLRSVTQRTLSPDARPLSNILARPPLSRARSRRVALDYDSASDNDEKDCAPGSYSSAASSSKSCDYSAYSASPIRNFFYSSVNRQPISSKSSLLYNSSRFDQVLTGKKSWLSSVPGLYILRPSQYSYYSNYNAEASSRTGNKWSWKRLFQYRPSVSTMILFIHVVFFVVLAVWYTSMLKDGSIIDTAVTAIIDSSISKWSAFEGLKMEKDGLKFPICEVGSSVAATSCLTQNEVSAVSRVLSFGRELVLEVDRRHVEYQCSESRVPYLTSSELILWMKQKAKNLEPSSCVAAVTAFAKLAELNPSLGLSAVFATDSASPTSENELLGLRIRSPRLHMLCALMNFLTFCLYLGAVLASVGVLFYGAHWMFTRMREQKKRNTDYVFELVVKVLHLVEKSSEGFCVIDHLRDKLIKPRERATGQAKLWKHAEEFIDNYESRIVRELKVIGGTEVEVWRWIGQKVPVSGFSTISNDDEKDLNCTFQNGSLREELNNANTIVHSPVNDSQKNKLYPELPSCDEGEVDGVMSPMYRQTWQGEGVSRRRSKVAPPTRCLKIRNCPVREKPAAVLQQELVQRCRGNDIMHVAIDQESAEGIVYLMASDVETAGNIHSLLHGYWFCGELLSVKFVREPRYLERFPNAAGIRSPLKAAVGGGETPHRAGTKDTGILISRLRS